MAVYSLANQAGAAFRAALNAVLGKLQGNYTGTTDPVTATDHVAGMFWLDTSASPPILKIRNATNTAWVAIGEVDSSFLLSGSTPYTRTFLDDTSAAAARTTLGLGGLAVLGTSDILIDEDSFASDLATKAPSQQSVKAYVDTAIAASGGNVLWADLGDPVTAGDTTRYSDDPEHTVGALEVIFSAYMANGGTLRLTIDHRKVDATSNLNVLLNGSSIQTWSNTSISYTTRTLDITFARGDRLEVQHYRTGTSGSASARNLRLKTAGEFLFPVPLLHPIVGEPKWILS